MMTEEQRQSLIEHAKLLMRPDGKGKTTAVAQIALAALTQPASPALKLPDEMADPDYWQFKSVNGDWIGIGYQGMLQAVKEGCEVRPLYAAQTDLTLNAELYAELYRLREEVKGPDGFQTWKDAAVFERKRRVAMESLATEINYLGAMGAFHSDKWHKMDPITGYMHGWNACIAETKRLNGVTS